MYKVTYFIRRSDGRYRASSHVTTIQ